MCDSVGNRLAREIIAWIGGMFVLAAVLAAAAHYRLDYGPGFALVTLGVLALFGATAISRVRRYHPYTRFGGANAITSLRLLLACLLAGTATEMGPSEQDDGPMTLAVIAIAVGALCLDGVDGFVARRQRLVSRFGARFDMEVDAFLLLVLAVLAWRLDKADAWVLAIGTLRYVFLIAGLLWRPLAAELPVSRRRKSICAVAGVCLCAVLSPLTGPGTGAWIAAAALAALFASFAADWGYLVRTRHGPRRNA